MRQSLYVFTMYLPAKGFLMEKGAWKYFYIFIEFIFKMLGLLLQFMITLCFDYGKSASNSM